MDLDRHSNSGAKRRVLAVLVFWILLALPGVAWLQRFDASSLGRGALSALGRAYLVSLALLTPTSVFGYWLGAPLWTLSATYVVLVVLGAVALFRDRAWLALFARPGVSACAFGAWLIFDIWLGLRVGSHVQGDAGYHIARIRLLCTSGFNNWDPLLGAGHFEPIYYSNLYHALIASSAQLARVDAGTAWIWVWPFAKLMAAAGSYELAYAVLQSRACGYLAALACGLFFATASTQPFPNAFSATALSAFGLAFAVDAAAEPPHLRHAMWLGAASVVIAQTHSLYAAFLILAVGPLLGLRVLFALLRRRPGRLALLAAAGALSLSLPWLMASAGQRIETLWSSTRTLLVSRAQAQAAPAQAEPRSTNDRAAALFIKLAPKRWRMDAVPWTNPDNPDVHGGAALLVAAALGAGGVRRRALALLAIMASVAAWLFVPALCSLLINLSAHWVVVRLTGLFFVVCLALVPGVLLGVIGTRLRGPRQRVILVALELLSVLAVVAYSQRYGQYSEPWTREATWSSALVGRARENAARIASRADFFATHVAPGATVMAPVLRDYEVAMHCSCHGLAFRRGRGERAQGDMVDRRSAADQFYAPATSAETRREILARYGIRYVYTSPGRAASLARGMGPDVAVVRSREDALLLLQPK